MYFGPMNGVATVPLRARRMQSPATHSSSQYMGESGYGKYIDGSNTTDFALECVSNAVKVMPRALPCTSVND